MEPFSDLRELIAGQATILTKIAALQLSVNSLSKQEAEIMASIASILAAQAQEKTDLGLLTTAIQTLLTAFANESITPAQAQSILTEMQSEDSTVQSLSTSINNALNPPTPAPTPAPTGS